MLEIIDAVAARSGRWLLTGDTKEVNASDCQFLADNSVAWATMREVNAELLGAEARA